MRYRVKLFPEITIKSRPVRKQMVRCLRTNLRNILTPLVPDVRIADCWDALEVRVRHAIDDAPANAWKQRYRACPASTRCW